MFDYITCILALHLLYLTYPCFSPSKQIIHVSLTTFKYEWVRVYSDFEILHCATCFGLP
jgi:hypothetical protein